MKHEFADAETVTAVMSILLVAVTGITAITWKKIYDIYKG